VACFKLTGTGIKMTQYLKWLFFWGMVFATITVDIPLGNAQEDINYRLKWLFNTSVAGDLYALDMGYFKKEGLSVAVKAGSPERDAIRELELGQAQFGVASADQVILARSKGSPVIVIAQLFQKNPLQWIYRAEPGTLSNLSDLKGKTIGITYGGNDETIMRALLKKGGIPEKDVTLFSVRYDYTPFYRKRVDIWPVYINSQGIILNDKLTENGEKTGFFDPSSYGVRFVANSVVTSLKTLRERPAMVQSFIKALLEGWKESLAPENKQKTLSVLKKYDRDTPTDIREKQLAITRTLIIPEGDAHLGYIDREAWRQTEQIMLEQGLIPKPVSVTDILFQDGFGPTQKKQD